MHDIVVVLGLLVCVTALVPLSKEQVAEVETEGAALLEFLAPGAEHDLRWITNEEG